MKSGCGSLLSCDSAVDDHLFLLRRNGLSGGRTGKLVSGRALIRPHALEFLFSLRDRGL